MGVVFFDGFERAFAASGDTDDYPWHQCSGSTTSVSNVRSGLQALQGPIALCRNFDISNGDRTDWWFDLADAWVSFYVLIDANVTSGDFLFKAYASTNPEKLQLWWGSNNTIEVRSGTDTLIATSSTQLELNKWYRIDIRIGTGTSASYELRIHKDGAPSTTADLSGTFDQRTVNNARFDFGSDFAQDADNVFIDDVVIDDAGFFAEGEDYRVESIFPTGNGTDTAWTGDWNDVAGKVHDGQTTEITTSSNNDAETVTLDNIPAMQSNETVSAVMCIVHARKDDSVNPAVNVEIRDRSNSNVRDSAAFELEKDESLDSNQKWFVIYTTRPGGGAFTEANINEMEVGIVHAQQQSRAAFCTAMNVNVLIVMPPSTGMAPNLFNPFSSPRRNPNLRR